jgi:cobalt-zinc-cadmium resistance protein CzcA
VERLLHALIALSVKHRVAVLVSTLAFVAFAGWSTTRLRFDAFPDITTPQVQVVTSSPGLSSDEVEQLITLPIERALGGIPGVVEQRSLSRAGVSAITVVFEDGNDLWRARQLVKERVDAARADIPPDAGDPELGPPSTGLGEVYQFTLQSDRLPMPELYRLFERDVAPRLRVVAGVVEVNAWGGGAPQLEVRADPALMAAHGVTWGDLERALSDSIVRVSGGAIRRGPEQVIVRASTHLATPEALGAVPLREGLLVRDVAQVREGGALTVGFGTNNGRGEALFVMVQLLAGADALSVVKDLEDRTAEVRASLPEGVSLDVIYERNQLIHKALKTVARSLIEGGLLVVVVLLLLLGDLRAGFIVSSIIPLSLLGALAGLAWTGVTGNLMSLGAIDFGLVVDGAIVVTESVIAIELLSVGAARGEALKAAVIERAQRVAGPVSLAITILALVYTPILSLWGTEGKLFRPMALTVLFALAVAFVLSFTYVPALASWLIRPKGDHETALMRALSKLYRPILERLLTRPGLSVAVVLALIGASGVAATHLGVEFVPRLEEGDLVIQTGRLPSISPEQGIREATRVEQVVGRFPEVLQVASRVGSPAVATDPMGLEQGDVFVKLRPRDEWTTAQTTEGLVDAIAAAIAREAPGAQVGFTQPIEMRFNEMLEGITADVGIKVFGTDLGELRRLGGEIAGAIERVPGAADVKRPSQEGVASLTVHISPERLAPYGLTPADLAGVISGVQRGVEVGRVRRGLFQDAVVLKLDAPSHLDVGAIPVALPGGGVAPLSALADIEAREVPVTVDRELGSRRAVVQCNVRGRDLGGFVHDAQVAVAAVKLPPGYWIEWSGQYAQLEEATRRMAVLIPAVLIVILALLYASFRSFKLTLLIALNVPVAMSGGLITLWLTHTTLSLSAVVGCVALFGVAVMNGVVLLSRTRALELELGEGGSALEAARLSALERLRPVFTTALVAGLGFVPMALAQGVGAEVQRPLALVVIGGLVTSTTLTLFTLPSLYAWVFRRPALEGAAVASAFDDDRAV